MYLLNRVPSKAVPKTHFELWTVRKPSLRHLHVWGCPAEVRIYNPHEKKLDSRMVSYYFIGYFERSKGYKFYDPITKSIFESGNARFFEDVEFAREDKVKVFVFGKEFVYILLMAIDNDQDQAPIPDIIIPDIIQEATPEEQTLQL